MNRKGIKHQGIPDSNEISMKSHRLHAAAFSLSGDSEASLTEHEASLYAAQSITDVFDQLLLQRH